MNKREAKKYLPVVKAVATLTGHRIHPSTAWRWSTKGIRGIVLRTVLIGGRRMADLESVRKFLATTSDRPKVTPEVSPARRKLNHELQPSSAGSK